MKTHLNILTLVLLGGLTLGSWNARADLEVSTSVRISAVAQFHAPLTPHGAWIEVGSYGRCWRPSGIAVSWRPYCYGSWVWTDCGWYWESDEPWAWACYHYGYWVYESGYGWVWAPGIEWAPAWVTWRFGGGYCGWAPLAPRGVIVAPSLFVFVETGRFHERIQPSTVIVNNTTVINKTTVINNSVRRETRSFDGSGPRKVVINEGPKLADVQKATSRKVREVKIHEAVTRTPVPAEVKRQAQGVGKTSQPAPEHKATPGETRRTDEGPAVTEKKAPPGDAKPAPPKSPGPPSKAPGKPHKPDQPGDGPPVVKKHGKPKNPDEADSSRDQPPDAPDRGRPDRSGRGHGHTPR